MFDYKDQVNLISCLEMCGIYNKYAFQFPIKNTKKIVVWVSYD